MENGKSTLYESGQAFDFQNQQMRQLWKVEVIKNEGL